MLSLRCRQVRSLKNPLAALHRPNRAGLLCTCRRSATTTSASTQEQTKGVHPSSFRRSSSLLANLVIAGASLSVGFAAGQSYQKLGAQPHDPHAQQQHLPNGLPRTCCDAPDDKLTDDQKALPALLKKIAGDENVLDGRVATTRTLPFLRGARIGEGKALCIVTPRYLRDVVDVVQAIVDAEAVVLPQGQNTGLTGGSVPRNYSKDGGDDEDYRPVVVVSLKYLNRIFPIDDGKRVVCLAGTGLAEVIAFLDKEFPHRESHSTLGSTFLNPTTAAGVAFGSGGTQVRKGPAYTERALYLHVETNKWNDKIVKIVNSLGIEGMEDPQSNRARKMDSTPSRIDTWSRWISHGYERTMRYSDEMSPHGSVPASDVTYGERLCSPATSDQDRLSRFNADTRGPDPNRSEGKVVILATVHDTFPKPQQTKTFWVSMDSLETALAFRREVCLDNAQDLPVSVEYMDRDSFDVIDRAGRLLAKVIQVVGTASPIVKNFWNLKLWIEALPFDGADRWCDRILYALNPVVPAVLPAPLMKLGKRFDHHLALTVGDFGHGEMDRFLERMRAFEGHHGGQMIESFECTRPGEAASLTAFRFVAAPAFRTYCIGQGKQGLSVDYVLPKDDGSPPPLGGEEGDAIVPVKRMRYSHFACNVVHEDLAYETDVDVDKAKKALKHAVEHNCHGRLPAEHGFGTEYVAPPESQERWKKMDPLNVLNPGVGGLSYKFKYKE
jgi:D-lactate dehydrogenase